MGIKARTFSRATLILAPLCGLLLLFGNACSSNIQFKDLSLLASAASGGSLSQSSGNGHTYDGKLTFLSMDPSFNCENHVAPRAALHYNSDTRKWLYTLNERDKCARISNQDVTTEIIYDSTYGFLEFRNMKFEQDQANPDISLGLPDYPVRYQITAAADGNSASLKAAFDDLNSHPGRPAIVEIGAGLYKITTPLEAKNDSLLILHGVNMATTLLDGQGTSTILLNGSHNMMAPSINQTLILENLTFQNAYTNVSFFGSAIDTYGSLITRNVSFLNNKNLSGFGAVYAGTASFRGDLLIERTTFSGNTGGGLGMFGTKSVTVKDSSFTLNTGPAFYMENHTNNVRILSSSFFQNTVGIQLQACYGFCELENLTVTDNTMIGVHIFTTGGGDADIYIQNSTIYHNGSSSYQNLRFDALNYSPAQLLIKNSILASGASGAPNCTLNADAIPLTHFTASIVDDPSCGTGPGILKADPQLSALANNGGFTLTRAPSLTSPAIDAGDLGACLSTDQRGLPRPIDKLGGGARCDIGALELQ